MVQKINIEKMIEDSLPEELKFLDKKIESVQNELVRLISRRKLLTNIGVAAGVNLEGNIRDCIEGLNILESLSSGPVDPDHPVTFI